MLDLGAVAALAADAIGEPGHRTFRLLAAGGAASTCAWLEKEQLHALAAACQQLVARLGVRGDEQESEPSSVPEPYDAEFQIGAITIGYEEASGLPVILLYETDADTDGPPTVRFQATGAQLLGFSRQVERVVRAGRPHCPLCDMPLGDEPHACPRANGHGKMLGPLR